MYLLRYRRDNPALDNVMLGRSAWA
eukprot:COSAG01_NODE_69603_length_261_cov_0.537037_2_plen_24_part_01